MNKNKFYDLLNDVKDNILGYIDNPKYYVYTQVAMNQINKLERNINNANLELASNDQYFVYKLKQLQLINNEFYESIRKVDEHCVSQSESFIRKLIKRFF